MSSPRISLEQWRALMAVVEAGGYAQAAEALHKSQSAVSYAVQKIEDLLGVDLFEIQGRRAVLPPTGALLVRRAKALMDEASALEHAAGRLSAGWEAELRLAVEIIFPTGLLLGTLARFGQESPHTRIELIESVLGGTQELLLRGEADLAIAPVVPTGFLGEQLMPLNMRYVAAPLHPLHAMQRDVTAADLRRHRQVVVRDSGRQRGKSSPTVEATQRWTVSHMATSIQAVVAGHGFALLPEEKISEELAEGRLVPLPMAEAGLRTVTLYLVYADRDAAGPGLLRLVDVLREEIVKTCPRRVDSVRDPLPTP